MALLEGRDLRKTYRLGKRNVVAALRGVDVAIERGEMVAIMGPSGSGKSTLMHILGLLHAPDLDDGPRPGSRSAGATWSRSATASGRRIRAREMGFVFQEFNLIPTLTALENVMLAGDYAGVRRATGAPGLARGAGARRPCRPRRPPALRALGWRAAARRHRPGPGQPTGPRARRRADRQPRLRALGRGARGMLRRLNVERGQTFVLVTHDPDVGAACDRIVRMRDGGSARRPRSRRSPWPLRCSNRCEWSWSPASSDCRCLGVNPDETPGQPRAKSARRPNRQGTLSKQRCPDRERRNVDGQVCEPEESGGGVRTP